LIGTRGSREEGRVDERFSHSYKILKLFRIIDAVFKVG
jgi:hypothetical protein